MNNYKKKVEELFPTLDTYLPVVQRVHGPHHEEIYEVYNMYQKIKEDYKNEDLASTASKFERIREVTKDYLVPSDVCESYEAVYNMLKDLNEAYELDKK